jgi:putative glutamine amidotransferase
MSKKPVIGITGAYVNHNSFSEGLYVHHDYHKAVVSAGGLPIVIPYTNPELAIDTLQLCDAVILSGGEDVDPQFYSQDPHPKIGPTIAERDVFEITIVKYAIEHNLPLMAICRGLQILNVALGGTLIQDIPSQVENGIKHAQIVERSRDSHGVTIDEDSKLYQIFGTNKLRVNSLHHQALDVVADDLRVVARSSDGIVEAVEYVKPSTFTIGVQWHPESMASTNPYMKSLFDEFIKSSSKVLV